MSFLKNNFKSNLPSILCIGFNILIYTSCSSPPENSRLNLLEKYYSKAENFFENEEIDSSLYYIDRCFEIDRDYPKAHHLRGQVYLYKDGVFNRRVSATALKKAVLMDIDNAKYHYSLGLTLEKQGFFKNALDQFKEAVKCDSADIESYLKIAEISKKIGLRYDDKGYFEQSARAAAKAANLADNPQGFYKQAAALYQMQRYAIAARTLRDAVELCDDTSDLVDCELLLGTVLVRMGDFESANVAFESARSKMSDIARAEMDNPRFLMTPDNYKSITEESIFTQKRILRQFWGELDPDPTTEFNERKLEHYSRFIHARLTFSVPEKSIDGTMTKRGEMYIRYGPPSSKSYVLGGGGSAGDPPKWVWIYDQFPQPVTLVFEDTFLDGEFNFPFPTPAWTAADYAGSSSFMAENLRGSNPQIYSLRKGSGPLNFAFLPRQFKGSRGKTDVEIFIAIPSIEMEFERKGERAYSDIEWRQVLRYPSWRVADSASAERTYDMRASLINNAEVDLSDRLKLTAFPDTLVLAVSLRDMRSEHAGIVKTGIRLRDFYTDKVELSDLVLARRIDQPPRKVNFEREDIRILSNLDNRYFAGEPVWLYFEIYNLELGPDEKTSYTINQIITERKSSGLLAAIKETVVGGDYLEVITSYEGSSIHTYENRILSLDLSELEEGNYYVTIEVVDNISGKTSRATESIVLYR